MEEDFIEKLGTNIKDAERSIEGKCIPASDSFIVRLDGVSFKNYTSSLQKPFDQRFTQAMRKTTESLMKKFQPAIAFVQSDEISLLFNPIIQKDTRQLVGHLYRGRVFKLISILAGATSSFFMTNFFIEEPAFFDARLVLFDSLSDVFIWRAYDLRRNAVNAVGQKLYGHERINNVPLRVLENQLLGEYGCLEEKFGPENLFGTLFKRKIIIREGYNPIKGIVEQAERIQFEGRSVDLLKPNGQSYFKNPFWD